jgi:hypothetical protein
MRGNMANLLQRIHEEVQRAPTSHGPLCDRPNSVLSDEDIIKAETRLGCQLPQFLKQLYTEVGNGGFGPGHGLLPLVLVGELRCGRCVLDLYQHFQQSKKWNSSVVPFASWGCGILSCLDLSENIDPPVYRFEPNMPDEFTYHYLNGSPYRGSGLIPEGMTLSQWLCGWLDGHAKQMFDQMNVI